jgi:outer membrane assembly lipoprotein YfgL
MPASRVRARPAALLCALGAVLLSAGCGSDKPKPTPLGALEPKIAGRQVWQARVESVQFPLVVAVREGRFFTASDAGSVLALDAASGRELWRAQVGARITAGVGSDGRHAAVVTVGNEVVVLDGGRELWRKSVPARTVTAPLVAGERVFVMTVDRAVHAFDVLDGRRLWVLQRPGDALTLGQAGVVTAFKDTLLVGQGPRLTGVDPLRGTVRWEVAIANPRGTNEVERLADLLGPPVRVGDSVCVRSFQAAVGCADAEAGKLQWSRNTGGVQAVAADETMVVGADASDRLTGWRKAGGEVAWSQEQLLHRGLSGGALAGRIAVFGDSEGIVHFLDRDSGAPLLRLPTDGSAVVGTPALAGTTMLVATRNGGLFAFRPE